MAPAICKNYRSCVGKCKTLVKLLKGPAHHQWGLVNLTKRRSMSQQDLFIFIAFREWYSALSAAKNSYFGNQMQKHFFEASPHSSVISPRRD